MPSSRLTDRPRFDADAGLFQKTQQRNYTLGVIEELRQVSGAATDSEVLEARGVVQGAFEEHLLHRLDWLSAGASHLFLCVVREEPLGVRAYDPP